MTDIPQVGQAAPDFSVEDQDSNLVSLQNFPNQWVVLYFYPKDNTPGCTKEACLFRDSYEDFKEAGAEVIGISSDSEASHQKFAEKHNLPFTLLSDPKNEARKAFDVPKTLFVLPGRVTYVIDKEGIVKHIFDSMLDFNAHVQESLNVIQSL